MPKICKKCKSEFPYNIKIDGKNRNLGSRKYCLTCSPFNKHNTSKLEVNKLFKICTNCKAEKSLSDFYMKTNGYPYTYCKKCMNSKRVQYFKDMKTKSVKYMGGKCSICGYNKCQDALEFHHKNPDKKDFSISSHRGTNFDKIKKELDKCIMLCSNCHREVHAGLHTQPEPSSQLLCEDQG